MPDNILKPKTIQELNFAKVKEDVGFKKNKK